MMGRQVLKRSRARIYQHVMERTGKREWRLVLIRNWRDSVAADIKSLVSCEEPADLLSNRPSPIVALSRAG
jgi:hypothetical protein